MSILRDEYPGCTSKVVVVRQTYAGLTDPMGRPYDTQPAPTVGPVDARLMAQLEGHLAGEQDVLDEYRRLAETSSDEAVRYLARLLLEDEEHHHRTVTEMLNSVRTHVWLAEQTPRVPWLTRGRDPELRRTVRRLRRFERKDLRQLRRLQRELRCLRDDSLNGTLVRALRLDTRKHLLYLDALARISGRR